MKVSVAVGAVLVMTFAVALAPAARAADAGGAKGSVKGKVVRPDGTAAAGAELRLMARPDKAAKRAEKDAANKENPAAGAKPERPARGAGRDVVASATADLNGEFHLADVPVGNYVLVARQKGGGNARQPVTVHAGDAAAVTLTLKAPGVQEKPGKRPGRKATRAERQQARAAHKRQAAGQKAGA
jgi:hypothetical protein